MGQAGSEIRLARQLRQQPCLDLFQGDALRGVGHALLGGDLQRDDAAQEVAGDAHMRGDAPRRLVMAGDQPPQLALDDDRDRHRGGGVHVAHIVEMHRRDAAQTGEAHIERRAVDRAHRRIERYRGVGGVGNEPQAVGAVKLARLGWNVRGGKAQIEIGGQGAVAVLGDHHAVPIGLEAIDHHAVEAGQAADFRGGGGGQCRDRLDRLNRIDKGADARIERVEGLDIAAGCFLEFDDDALGAPVGDDLQMAVAGGGGAQEQRLVAGGPLFHLGRETRIEAGHVGHRTEIPAIALEAQKLGRVGAALDDFQGAGLEHEQRAMRLDGAGDADRLPGALLVVETSRLIRDPRHRHPR